MEQIREQPRFLLTVRKWDVIDVLAWRTWRAFVDITAWLPGCDWFVVESDLGVGGIQVAPTRRLRRKAKAVRPQAPSGYDAAWKWLVEHRTELLHPLSIADWQLRASRTSESIH